MDPAIKAKIEHYYEQGRQMLAAGQHDGAHQIFTALLEPLQVLEDVLGQAHVRMHLGQIAEILGRPDEAVTHYGQALQLALQLADRQLEAMTAHRLGVLIHLGRPADARRLLRQAEEACIYLGDTVGRALSHAMLGRIDCLEGKMEAGLRMMLAALGWLPTGSAEHAALLDEIRRLGHEWSAADLRRLVQQAALTQATRQALLATPLAASAATW